MAILSQSACENNSGAILVVLRGENKGDITATKIAKDGVPGGIRTPNLLIRSQRERQNRKSVQARAFRGAREKF